ncbi:MAG: hypothetical protein CMJ71_06360 [Planctomycetaceae bacterium]|nr:hypothetical protein [Planctomycetaceae bacterium]
MNGFVMNRRLFLRQAGVAIGLPFLPSLTSSKIAVGSQQVVTGSKKMVCIGNMLGFHPAAFWPSAKQVGVERGFTSLEGFEYGTTTQPLNEIREQSTLIQGLDHDTKGGHFGIHSFLSGVKQNEASSMIHGNVTIDQFAAEHVVGQTRFPSLTIGSLEGIHGGCQLSWTRTGTRVPPIPGPEQLFKKLFVDATEQDKDSAADRFALQNSILDVVQEQAHDLQRSLNQRDKNKLDEYFTSVRDVEKGIARRRRWIDVPKPEAMIKQPRNRNMVEDLPLLYDLIVMALQTNATKVATLEIGGDFNPADLGIRGGYHSLSHHGQLQDRIDALITLETYQIEQFVRFVKKLAVTLDDTGPLLDTTTVLFGSGMGDANSHTNRNLPIVLAGGSFTHRKLLAFDTSHPHRPPLANLFVSMLQEFGVEAESFAKSTGTLRGLV